MIAFPQLSIHFPGKLVFGKDTLPQLANDIIALKQTKVLLITIKPLLIKLDSFINILKAENIVVLIETSIEQEPTFNDFYSLINKIIPFNPDVVIGIGGG